MKEVFDHSIKYLTTQKNMRKKTEQVQWSYEPYHEMRTKQVSQFVLLIDRLIT